MVAEIRRLTICQRLNTIFVGWSGMFRAGSRALTALSQAILLVVRTGNRGVLSVIGMLRQLSIGFGNIGLVRTTGP
jgi:hypothetical protein